MADLPFSPGATKMLAVLPMNERYLKWYTTWLERGFEMLVFGHESGLPRTRKGSYGLPATLNLKGIGYWLDGKWRGHNWNYRQDVLPYGLSLL